MARKILDKLTGEVMIVPDNEVSKYINSQQQEQMPIDKSAEGFQNFSAVMRDFNLGPVQDILGTAVMTGSKAGDFIRKNVLGKEINTQSINPFLTEKRESQITNEPFKAISEDVAQTASNLIPIKGAQIAKIASGIGLPAVANMAKSGLGRIVARPILGASQGFLHGYGAEKDMGETARTGAIINSAFGMGGEVLGAGGNFAGNVGKNLKKSVEKAYSNVKASILGEKNIKIADKYKIIPEKIKSVNEDVLSMAKENVYKNKENVVSNINKELSKTKINLFDLKNSIDKEFFDSPHLLTDGTVSKLKKQIDNIFNDRLKAYATKNNIGPDQVLQLAKEGKLPLSEVNYIRQTVGDLFSNQNTFNELSSTSKGLLNSTYANIDKFLTKNNSKYPDLNNEIKSLTSMLENIDKFSKKNIFPKTGFEPLQAEDVIPPVISGTVLGLPLPDAVKYPISMMTGGLYTLPRILKNAGVKESLVNKIESVSEKGKIPSELLNKLPVKVKDALEQLFNIAPTKVLTPMQTNVYKEY